MLYPKPWEILNLGYFVNIEDWEQINEFKSAKFEFA